MVSQEELLAPMVRQDEPIRESPPRDAPRMAPRLAETPAIKPNGEPNLVRANGVRVAPVLLPYLQALRDRARSLGARFKLGSGYRSLAEQDTLRVRWERGDPTVVFPPAKYSYHTLGLAVDLDGLNRDQLRALGEYWESIGGRWGGRFGDFNHFDLGRR